MENIEMTDWVAYKALLTTKHLHLQFKEYSDVYHLMAPDGSCILWRIQLTKGTSDCTDFEDNYKPTANGLLIPVIQTTPFSANQVIFRGEGIYDTVPAGTEKDIDFKITYNALLNGGILQTKGEEMGDYFSAHVVDKDNIFGYGAGTVLNTWIVKWYALNEDVHMDLTTPQAGSIPANLYLRIKYKSIGATDVKVLVNYRLNQAL